MKVVAKSHVNKSTLSLKNDPYMDSHRFGKTPYFPFVMGLEYFLDCIKKDKGCVVFSNYTVNSPIMLRKDRDKDIFISLKETQESSYDVSIVDDRDRSHISGSISLRESIRSRDAIEAFNQKPILEFDHSIYGELLPHGPHFHSNFDIVSMDETELRARQFNFNNKLKYLNNRPLDELQTNPALLDGLLQLCAIHSMKFDQKYMLPTSVNNLFVNFTKIKELTVAYVICKKCAPALYDIVVANEDGDIICKFDQMTFSTLNRDVKINF